MRKSIIIISSILVMLLLAGCGAEEAPQPTATAAPVELKKYRFTSAEEVEQMSDEDLIYINQHPYRTADFYEEGEFTEIDFFGVELDKENGEYMLWVKNFWVEDLEIELDVSKPLPEEEFNRLVNNDIEMMYYYANTKKPDEETGSVVISKDTFCCGENDMYAMYSVRYTVENATRLNGKLTTKDITSAYRKLYLKNYVMKTNVENWQAYLLGELSVDYVQEQLDIFSCNFPKEYGASNYVPIIYREVIEEEDRYIYVTYYTIFDYCPAGENNVVILEKSEEFVDKETHLVTSEYPVEVRRVEIPDTEYIVEQVY